MKIIHFDSKHALVIYKIDGVLGLAHHGQVLFEIECNNEEIQIFKKLYNKIVENHNKLNISYRKKELVKTHLKKYPIMRPAKILKKMDEFSFQKYTEHDLILTKIKKDLKNQRND